MKIDNRLAEAIVKVCGDKGTENLAEPLIKFVENLASEQIKEIEISRVLTDIYSLIPVGITRDED